MHFSDVEVGKQLIVGNGTYYDALGLGGKAIRGSAYIEGPFLVGDAKSFGGVSATTMIARDVNEESNNPPRSLHVNGNAQILGDSGTQNALFVTGGGSVDSVYIDGDLYVTGSTDTGNKGRLASRFSAADGKPKPFDIKHPSKEGWRLRYACIEGPEVGVYCRGRVRGEKIIKLPDYWKDLVDVESISVQLQPIGAHQDVIVKRWDEQFIYLQSQGGMPINCFYHVYASRKDVNPLHVEYEGKDCFDYPDPNYGVDVENPVYNDSQYAPKRNIITI